MTHPTLPLTPGDEILSIDFAPAGSRARDVVRRSNSRPTGQFPSMKMGRMLQWESLHELNAFRLLECTPAVIAVREQPCIIHYRLGGEEHRHYPDCLVLTAQAKSLWEIKTSHDAREPKVAARSAFLRQALPAFGYEYRLLLADELARTPRLTNALFLLRHGRRPLTFEEREHARRLFESALALRWVDVRDRVHAPFTVQQACRLVLDGVLALDLEAALDGEALLTCPPGTLWSEGAHG